MFELNQTGRIDVASDPNYEVMPLTEETLRSVAEYYDGKEIKYEKIAGLEEYKREEIIGIIARLAFDRPNGEYLNLTDTLLNRSQCGSHILRAMDVFHGCKDGMANPSKMGRYRLRPRRQFAIEVDGQTTFEYQPGDIVEWKQQIYTHVPLGPNKGAGKKKLKYDEIEDLQRRGQSHRVFDFGRARVDEFGLISVSYQDAAQLLYVSGFVTREEYGAVREMGICTSPQFSKKQIKHETKTNEMRTQTRNNWLFEEIPPWDEAKIRNRLESKSDYAKNGDKQHGKSKR